MEWTMELAGGLAAIVGLVSNFKTEHASGTWPEFATWLRERHREDIAQAIESNAVLLVELQKLLSGNHDQLMQELQQVKAKLDTVLAASPLLSGVQLAISPKPGGELSEQAISVVKQLLVKPEAYMLEHRTYSSNEPPYVLIASGPKLQVSEAHHLQEDLDALHAAGLVQFEFTSKGSRKYSATRAAFKRYGTGSA